MPSDTALRLEINHEFSSHYLVAASTPACFGIPRFAYAREGWCSGTTALLLACIPTTAALTHLHLLHAEEHGQQHAMRSKGKCRSAQCLNR